MNKRYIGAIILTPLALFLLLGGTYLRVLIAILSLLGMYEFYKVIKSKEINPISVVGYIMCIIYYIVLSNNMDFKYTILIFTFAVFIMFCIPTINTKYNFIDISVTMLGFIYVAVFFSFIVLVNIKNKTVMNTNVDIGKYFVWIIFISSWMCDTAAYYSGKYLGKQGKHKLCPKVSPNKTVEGSIGGMLGSTVSCMIFGQLINTYGTNMELLHISLIHYAFIGILSGIFSQFGDLAASSIKRHVNVKDYGKLIPGHGGILDRFDSILFSSVIVYYYVSFILNI
ncbi:phosphatidate cytidylyltransferase [Clostridium akagii]|uniref:phosphatidate cytidylyltransferase n=1 Tax=Clostridium akagii TaxID=91623 RepID=UPI00047E578E|nr:phosphatidate cytidylyltransferase [Clostridium akagii]